MTFSSWKTEKGIAALVSDAQDLSDKLATAKPHMVEAQAAAAWLWQARHLDRGQDLYALTAWTPAARARFVAEAQTTIAALRKARDYDSSDGLTVWLHTARALSQPRMVPPVRQIWQHLLHCGPNADSMAEEMIREAGLTPVPGRRVPDGLDGGDHVTATT